MPENNNNINVNTVSSKSSNNSANLSKPKYNKYNANSNNYDNKNVLESSNQTSNKKENNDRYKAVANNDPELKRKMEERKEKSQEVEEQNENSLQQANATEVSPELTEKEKNDIANENLNKNAIKVLKAIPATKAVGHVLEGIDKASGGKFSKKVGQGLTKAANKMPGGKELQKDSRDLFESGDGDRIGKAADAFSASKGGTGANANNANTGDKSNALSKSGSSNNSAGSGLSLGDNSKGKAGSGIKKIAKRRTKEMLKKQLITIIVAAAPYLLLIILIIILFSDTTSATNKKEGYYDSACNYNETNVTVTDCNDSQTIANINIKDYVLGATYAYTKGSSYSDDALKAAMIVIKTNALSYGNYNSNTKDISITTCNLKFCDLNMGCVLDGNTLPENNDYKEKLEELYEEINTYLYISKSYNSAITTLSDANVLKFDDAVFQEFEILSQANDYISILDIYYKNSSSEHTVTSKDMLFIGDSRTHGLVLAGALNDSNSVYASGKGYEWFIGKQTASAGTNAPSGGIETAKDKMLSVNDYNIIIWLGVNDLHNANVYFNKYKELATNEWSRHTIYVASVGPVDDTKSAIAKNEAINNFNNTMKNLINNSGLSNLKFIDLNVDITSLNSSDGVHYSSEGYNKIYNIISNSVGINISSELNLYNMSNYCTYYNLTENDAYWWPIGSDEPTNGNIYGGEPKYKTINSTFGPRINPYTQEYQDAHGAIDIPAPSNTPIIATKNGTVNFITTGCIEGNEKCGGGYGNHIKIDHGNGIESLYAHLNSVLVKTGQTVSQGQIIGYSGSTGRSTGPHLHFEIRLNGQRVDPENYVNPENPRPVIEYNVNISGEAGDYKNMLCSSLLESGFSKNATIGIMSNVARESGIIPTNLQNTWADNHGYTDSSYTLSIDNGTYTKEQFIHDSAGYGLAQWTYWSRKEKLYNYIKNLNLSIGSFEGQYKYMLHEVESDFKKVYSYIGGNHTALDMGTYWCDHYESPAAAKQCWKDGNCPSQHCINETQKKINEQNLINYVTNGCME